MSVLSVLLVCCIFHITTSKDIVLSPNDPLLGAYLAYNKGVELMRTIENNPDAIPHFIRSIEIKPDIAEARNNLGLCLFDKNRYTEALYQFEKGVQISTSQGDFNLVADASFNLGRVYQRIDRMEEARVIFMNTLERDPQHPSANINMGNYYYYQGDREEAARYQYLCTFSLLMSIFFRT